MHMSGKTRAIVTAKIRGLEQQREAAPTARVVDEMTVAGWFEYWLETVAAARVRARTLDSYRSIARRRIVPAIGHRTLRRLRPEHLEQLYAGLLGRGLSPATMLRDNRVLSRALKLAHQRDHVRRSVEARSRNPSRWARSAPCSRPRRIGGTRLAGVSRFSDGTRPPARAVR
jgi:integrase